MQANDDDAASTASTEASIFGGANEPWENQYRQIHLSIRTDIATFKKQWADFEHANCDEEAGFDCCARVDQLRVTIVQDVNKFILDATQRYSANKEHDIVTLRKLVTWVKRVEKTLNDRHRGTTRSKQRP